MSDTITTAAPDSRARGEHRFECEGSLAPNQRHPLRFTFRAFADGTLTVEITGATGVRSTDPMCYAYNGRAVLSTIATEPGVFECTFKLVRLWRHLLQVQFLECTARLSASAGLEGHYVIANGDDDEQPRAEAQPVSPPIPLHLPLVVHTHGSIVAPMLPLTPGTYTFKGFSVAASGMVLECIVELELHSDGTLEGTHHLLFMQHCEVRGTWTQDHVEYMLAFKFDESAAHYLNTFTPSLGGLRGDWALQDEGHGHNPMHGGEIDLILHSTTRVWSTAFHKKYPPVFQHVAKMLLLQAVRPPVDSHKSTLPSVIWQHVLSFCDFHHFEEETDTTM